MSKTLCGYRTLLATVAAVLVRTCADSVQRTLETFLSQILPPGTHDLAFYYFAVRGSQPLLLPIGAVLFSLWAASGVIVSLSEAFRAAYQISTGRSFFRERMVAILLVFSAAIPALFASALMLFGRRIQQTISAWIGLISSPNLPLHGWLATAGTLTRYTIAFTALILGTSMLYYFAPNRRQKWKNVWPGAIFATICWFAATSLFAWYARNLANYNVIYGGIGGAIALLVWMYVLAVIAILGCEYNALCEKMRHPARRRWSGLNLHAPVYSIKWGFV